MGRAGGLVMGAIVLGLALTLALVAALDPPAPRAFAPAISGADAPPDYGDTLRRCRTATEAVIQGHHLRHVGHRDFFTGNPGDGCAQGDRNQNECKIMQTRRQESGKGGQQHADTRPLNTASCGNR